jgi:MFS family permease
LIAITLLGWGIGGMLGGILSDYVGRKRTMVIAIIAYSIDRALRPERGGMFADGVELLFHRQRQLDRPACFKG